MRLSTNSPLDKLLNGGIESDAVTNIYGPAGSGKTNVALTTLISCCESKKAIYVDTEGSFSLERFQQLGGSEEELKNIIFLEPTSWKEQHDKILKMEKLADSEIGLIVVDSLVALYRLELSEDNFHTINKQLATQYSVLSRISRMHKIPVLVTNQVYNYKDDGGERIELTSRTIAKYWSKALIELKKTERANCRVAIIRKHRSQPEGKSIEFEITESKLKEIKLGIF